MSASPESFALPWGARHCVPAVFFLMARLAAAARPGTESELLVRLARGEPEALRALFDAHAGQALALAQRVLRSPAEAEEIVQEAFVELWRRAPQYDATRGGPQAWLLTIVRTRAIDRLRARTSARRTAEAAASEPAPASPTVPLELLAQRQDRERIATALEQLPTEQRAAIELAYFEGLSQREIAERTATPLGTVKTRVRLALQKLAELLEPRERAP